MNRKEAATAFLEMVLAKRVGDAYERYIAPDFIHHNQFFKGDRKTLMEAMQAANQASPAKRLDIKRVFEDGDYVITHSHVKQNPDDVGGAVIHIFRFENDKVVELWDLGQPLSKDSPNENGPF